MILFFLGMVSVSNESKLAVLDHGVLRELSDEASASLFGRLDCRLHGPSGIDAEAYLDVLAS